MSWEIEEERLMILFTAIANIVEVFTIFWAYIHILTAVVLPVLSRTKERFSIITHSLQRESQGLGEIN